jgi:phosphatidylserine/phosphatidylglycerophosphate/cardiolipin synthase-like enzyme
VTPTRRHSLMSWIVLIAILAAIAAALAWRAGLFPESASLDPVVPIRDDDGVTGLIVEPDDGRQPLLDEIAAANESVKLEVYLLSDDEIVDALIAADRRGIDVRVMLEENPFGGNGTHPETFDRLLNAGIETRWAPSSVEFAHIKAMIVDDETLFIMNMNLTRSAFTVNREFAVLTTNPAAVTQAVAIFDADWEGGGDRIDGPLVVSPWNSRSALLDLIDGAKSSIDLYIEFFSDRELRDALIAASDRGVAVRCITPSTDDDNARALFFALMDGGVEVLRFDDRYVHAKAIVVDRNTAFVGSQNFTSTSLDENRELGAIVTEPELVARLIAIFERDRAAAQPFS